MVLYACYLHRQDGDKFWKIPEVYIRGNTIKYLCIPDEVIDMVQEEATPAKSTAYLHFYYLPFDLQLLSHHEAEVGGEELSAVNEDVVLGVVLVGVGEAAPKEAEVEVAEEEEKVAVGEVAVVVALLVAVGEGEDSDLSPASLFMRACIVLHLR